MALRHDVAISKRSISALPARSRTSPRPQPALILGPPPRLSGRILLYKAHGIDSTRGPTFGDVTGHEEVNAVPHENSVFHTMMKLVAWDAFDDAIERHGVAAQARVFTWKNI